jgi:hypothetical protein
VLSVSIRQSNEADEPRASVGDRMGVMHGANAPEDRCDWTSSFGLSIEHVMVFVQDPGKMCPAIRGGGMR